MVSPSTSSPSSSSSSAAWGVARSPTIHAPTPQPAVPTGALLDAHRRHFRLFQKDAAKGDVMAGVEGHQGQARRHPSHPREPYEAAVRPDSELPTQSASSSASTWTTTAPSSTPPSNGVVMETLVRRYHAAESRLDRWRHADSSSRTAAALRRQRRRAQLQKAARATDPARGTDVLRTSRSLVNAVLERSAVSRVVQSWWGRVWTRGAAVASPGKRDIGARVRRSTTAQGYGSRVISRSPAWLMRTGRDLFGRLSHSLAHSSNRGQSSRVELVDATTNGANRRWAHDTYRDCRGTHDSDSDDEDWQDAPLTAEEAAYGSTYDALVGEPTAVQIGGGAPVHLASGAKTDISSEGSDSRSSSSSNSSDEDVEQFSKPREDTRGSATRSVEVNDESRFTLSWIRGLRKDRNETSAATPMSGFSAADDSFRSASRLLAKSRARFSRWVERQRRLQSAKRAVLRERWRRFSQRTDRGDRTPTSSVLGVKDQLGSAHEGRSAAVSGDAAQVSSPLGRRMLQRGASSWEQTVSWAAVANTSVKPGEDQQATERAQVRAALQRAIAAVVASRAAQTKTTEQSSIASNEGVAATPAPALSRAARQELEHAKALTRLKESMTALTRLRAGAPLAAEEQLHDHQEVHTGLAGDATAHTATASTILASRHSAYLRQLHEGVEDAAPGQPTQDEHATSVDASTDEADAFRSLLVDTTHTPRDTAVRLAYEAIMRDVCGEQVRLEVDSVARVSRGAADRALSQWVERQMLTELAHVSAQEHKDEAPYRSDTNGSAFTGILHHIHSRVPVSLSNLRLDDADRRALASVQDRRDSDTTAASLQTAGYTITYRQLASLNADAWLNDQVINNYLQLLCEDVEHRQQPHQHAGSLQKGEPAAEAPHSIASMGTHFYAKVESEVAKASGATAFSPMDEHRGPDAATITKWAPLASNSATLRWLRRRQHLLEPFRADDPQSVRAVLVPVNIEAQHWALVVYYRDDQRWVLYDSMSRSDRARQRGLLILSRLAHVWRECQRHYGFPVDDSVATRTEMQCGRLIMAAAYAPTSVRGKGVREGLALIDTMQPYGSIDELHHAAKRLRHQEECLEEGEEQAGGPRKAQRDERPPTSAPLTAATSLPASMLSDAEVEWFTDGFAHIPQQRNGNDCGVFVCQVAWCVAHGVAVSFTQTDVTLLRHAITLELLHGKLLRRYPTEHTSSSADV